MIPNSYLQEWSAKTPWPDPRQVEQDLIICRALCDLFNDPFLARRIAVRGGTAINKLLFRQPLRYSEDIDLVQAQAEAIGPAVDAARRLFFPLPCLCAASMSQAPRGCRASRVAVGTLP